jgi:hypothetical protein
LETRNLIFDRVMTSIIQQSIPSNKKLFMVFHCKFVINKTQIILFQLMTFLSLVQTVFIKLFWEEEVLPNSINIYEDLHLFNLSISPGGVQVQTTKTSNQSIFRQRTKTDHIKRLHYAASQIDFMHMLCLLLAGDSQHCG